MASSNQNELTARVLSSYLSNNTVDPADLPGVIESVKKHFGGGAIDNTTASQAETANAREPVVPVKRSVTPEAIVCLVCGRGFKVLKRHLQSVHHLDSAEYRSTFRLTSDHPLVAPNYSAERSKLAKSSRIGRQSGKVDRL